VNPKEVGRNRAIPIRTAVIQAALIVVIGASISWAEIRGFQDRNGYWRFGRVSAGTHRPYERIIRAASGRFGVEHDLILAVIKAESNFDDRAVSPKGARGLMQLMPGTAQDLKIGDPFDPEENIFGGALYLKKMLVRFAGDLRLALAGYNAGPEKVEMYKGIPPFRETREFIDRVLEHYEAYRSN
jgi:soluble lytic murein transglycosylase